MPTVEIDEVQLQQNTKLRQTVEGWLRNPKAKRKILEAQKLVAMIALAIAGAA